MEAIPSLLQGRRACEAGRRGPSVVNPLLMPASNFMGLIVIGSGSFSKAAPPVRCRELSAPVVGAEWLG